jgi:hypothetical protein
VAGCLVAGAPPVAAKESRSAAAEATSKLATVPWAAYEVGAGERSVLVGYTSGCGGGGAASASVAEARESVTITVQRERRTRAPGRWTSCPPPQLRFLTVELLQPLNGRELVGALGESPSDLVCVECRPTSIRVPGLVGFSLKNARTALKLAGLGAVVRRACSKSHQRRGVMAQTPGREHRVPNRTRVRLCIAKD